MNETAGDAIEEYLGSLTSEQGQIIASYYRRVPPLVPDAVVGVSYRMPCYL